MFNVSTLLLADALLKCDSTSYYYKSSLDSDSEKSSKIGQFLTKLEGVQQM